MSISFHEEGIKNFNFDTNQKDDFFLSKLIVKLKITKDTKQADIVSAAILICIIIISISIFYTKTRSEPAVDIPYGQLTETQKREIPLEIRQEIEKIEWENNF
jgi:hypothetical protein